MDVRLHAPDGYENFTGDARYIFNAEGFLVIYTNDGRRRTYSPSGWSYIEEKAAEEGSWALSVH